VTKLEPLQGFYMAEEYHQNYAERHPRDMYIVLNDAPKVVNLKRSFPDVFVER
jgi:peptide-methionine (S)-S-oxide reductase